MSESLTQRLVTFDEPALTTLLSRRPDAIRGAEPRDLAEVGELLSHPASLFAVLSTMPRPCLQLVEAAAALGSGATRARLLGLLDDANCSPRGHEADVDDVLSQLYDVALAWPGEGGRIRVPDALGSMFGAPLRLGQPLGQLLHTITLEQIRGIQATLGLERGRDKADAMASLHHHLGQADIVRAIVAKATPIVRAELIRHAEGGDLLFSDDFDDFDDFDDESSVGASADTRTSAGYDAGHGSNYVAARQWAAERGIMIGSIWSYNWSMPAEVTLALRGPNYRAPFAAQVPAMNTNDVAPDAVESESAVAATAFADHTLAILDRVHRSPLPRLKSGGVGVRELSRLAKTVACGEVNARMSLELAHASGLLETSSDRVLTSERFVPWRAQDPGIRFTGLLWAWLRMGRNPSEARDLEGKSIPALAPREDCAGCRKSRQALLEEAARSASGVAADRSSVTSVMLWRRPLLHDSPQDVDRPFATLWHEAELLGLLSLNAISRLGRVALEGNVQAIAAQSSALLPLSSDHATFGTDLTAMVVGAPSARVSSLLDSCADREGRGGATIWRLSPTSIRRALDDGTTGPELERSLASVASTTLPQPLGYLIADVTRRHGLLRVSPAVSVIRSEDTALLAEVAVNRRLKSLGLSLLAPTLLACDVPVKEALAAMRTAGYFPLPERNDDAASTRVDGIPAASDAAPPGTRWDLVLGTATLLEDNGLPEPVPEATDPASVAARLVGKGRRSLRIAPSGTEAELAHLNRQLPDSEVRQLAHAIDHGLHAVIEYMPTGGGRTVREISDIQLIGSTIYAVCGLRQEDREFNVSRIQSVSPL